MKKWTKVLAAAFSMALAFSITSFAGEWKPDGYLIVNGEADGYSYMDMMGVKVKQPMPRMDALNMATSNLDQTNVDTSMMHNLKMRKDGDNTILTYTTDVEYLNDYMNQTAALMAEEGSGMAIEYNLKSNTGEVVIDKNGYYVKQDLYMDMDMTMKNPETGEPLTIGYIMDVYMYINNPGDPVKVTIPSTEGYTDINEMTE